MEGGPLERTLEKDLAGAGPSACLHEDSHVVWVACRRMPHEDRTSCALRRLSVA